MQTPEEIMQEGVAAKSQVMAAQQKLLESRYNLSPKLDTQVTMSRGKPIPIEPTARLAQGMDWDTLAKVSPDAIRPANAFPYPALPHPKQVAGGQVFPQVRLVIPEAP